MSIHHFNVRKRVFQVTDKAQPAHLKNIQIDAHRKYKIFLLLVTECLRCENTSGICDRCFAFDSVYGSCTDS